ncbi:hypothetical protein BDF21DRAFT_409198 [Thamnidium elegans]|uniref:Uncharacterized protein n=1 Tax=Thamnidium elegans TaxID=101142 RepID=A0A8H7VWC3_9FUNG|nr:hypothetical protein INT48_008516 [Thamnidium elegans]KAI8094650.1 hypothetical protein BDF21DRAFT_409198 [Thamnidium elegans]
MLSSRKKTDILLQLDDEEDNRRGIASIDTAHHFLNFSRKVTEASSMRKPVDIQLGISCGKDLLFGSPSRMLRRSPFQTNKPSVSSTTPISLTKKDVKEAMNLPLPIKPVHDVTDNESQHKSTQQKVTIKSTNSPLLDRLVADVLNHIESCPQQAAYSDDLDRLKPKLQAYTVTHSPPQIKIVN